MNDAALSSGFYAVQSEVAAVDLGSNSFHMVVARMVGEELTVVDRLRERVALRAGLDDRRYLTMKAQLRAVQCLERFGQRIREMPPESVRVVGTNTLRSARNARSFMIMAQMALGHPIEIVSGAEEARLIHLGVSHSIPRIDGNTLVVDIGGGSTECIVGQAFEPVEGRSLHMGCVSYSKRFFPRGVITEEAMARAITTARRELEPHAPRLRRAGWDRVVGASGTILALEAIHREMGLTIEGVTREGLDDLQRRLVEAGHSREIALPGMKEDRRTVLAGGLAVLQGVFQELELTRMATSAGALREGVLYDLLGRIHHEDVRERTIRNFAEKYLVDREHAARVERVAQGFLEQVAESWELPRPTADQYLRWAAQLHEIGLAVGYNGYHKHGAYLVSNTHMAGFSRQDQAILGALVLGHRRKFLTERFAEVADGRRELAIRLAALLRLAVLLTRSRSDSPLPELRLSARGSQLRVEFPEGWLRNHSLTLGGLEDEVAQAQGVGLSLVFDDFTS